VCADAADWVTGTASGLQSASMDYPKDSVLGFRPNLELKEGQQRREPIHGRLSRTTRVSLSQYRKKFTPLTYTLFAYNMFNLTFSIFYHP